MMDGKHPRNGAHTSVTINGAPVQLFPYLQQSKDFAGDNFKGGLLEEKTYFELEVEEEQEAAGRANTKNLVFWSAGEGA